MPDPTQSTFPLSPPAAAEALVSFLRKADSSLTIIPEGPLAHLLTTNGPSELWVVKFVTPDRPKSWHPGDDVPQTWLTAPVVSRTREGIEERVRAIQAEARRRRLVIQQVHADQWVCALLPDLFPRPKSIASRLVHNLRDIARGSA